MIAIVEIIFDLISYTFRKVFFRGSIMDKRRLFITLLLVGLGFAAFLFTTLRTKENKVTIETEEGTYKTTVTCGKAKFNIMGKSPDTFTPIPDVEGEVSIEISNFALKEVIRQTVFSIADNSCFLFCI